MIRDPIAQTAPNDDVRCSIFRPSLFRKRLIEIVMCTGAGLETRKNVYMRVSQGVAGIAFRTQKTSYIPIQGDWKSQLMRDLGFTERELNRFQDDRKCYLNVPVLKRGRRQEIEVLAVVSLDSISDATFTQEMINVVDRIVPYIADVI
jgi:hypothetical protein